MSGSDECPNCGAGLSGDQRCHECGWPELLGEPEMLPAEGSEIEGIVDTTAMDKDGVFRPILFNQDGEEYMELTIEDAKRLLKFLNEAIPFTEKHLTLVRQ